MESKYKEGFYRLILLFGALMLALLAALPGNVVSRGVLAGSALVTGLAALVGGRFPSLPRASTPLLFALPLALLLWLTPERHAMWLWGWAAILVLPQALWMLVVNGVLAGLCWWRVYSLVPPEQGLLLGALLGSAMLLAVARSLNEPAPRQASAYHRRPITTTLLLPGQQLAAELPLEIARCEREGSYGELLLVRCAAKHRHAMIDALTQAIRAYEECFQLDDRTFAVLLIHRHIDEARARRQPLLAGLPVLQRARFVTLVPAVTLSAQHKAFLNQTTPTVILEEQG